MTQKEFIRALAFESRISDAMARKIVQYFKRVVRRTVEDGEAVQLTGLCEFRLRHLAARQVQIPSGERIEMPAMDLPVCRVSQSWRDECKARAKVAQASSL